MSETSWRLLITGISGGALAMAADHAIMEAVAEERVLPTLRFYAWEPACLSLGYTQPAGDVDRERLAAHGWDLVRRMTGGRAILHTDELTYSVTVPAGHAIAAGDVVESYRRLSQALLAGLRRLGADPQADRRAHESTTTKGPVCFEVPSHYEITVNGRKLIGSAQVRKWGVVLQHGSFPLYGDITRICDALVFESEDRRKIARDRVRERAATLENALGKSVTWQEAVDAMVEGFRETFHLTFETAYTLTPEEQVRAETLRVEQYISDTWNSRF